MFISEYHFIFLLTKKDFNWHVKCMHEVLYDVTCIPTLHNVQPGYKSLSIPTFLHSENIQNHFFWTFYKREIYSIISLALAPYLSIKCKSLLLTPTYINQTFSISNTPSCSPTFSYHHYTLNWHEISYFSFHIWVRVCDICLSGLGLFHSTQQLFYPYLEKKIPRFQLFD